MLIDASYFVAGPRRILNATLGTQSTEVNDAILNYAALLQQPFLVELLGEEVGNELHSYLVQKEEGEFVPDEALEDLAKRVSQSFADYVFFRICGAGADQATITGVARLKGPNEYVSPIRLQVAAWNRMVDRNREIVKWSESKECAIPGIVADSNVLTYINAFNL